MGICYGQLSLDERLEIFHYCRLGWSARRIAAHLGRSASTISREVARNGRRQTRWRGGYDPVRAHRLAARRRQVDKSRFKLVRQPDLLQHVVDHLAMGWSPQQISGRLAREQGGGVISHESIYRYIYYRREQKDYLCRLLPQARSRRRPRPRRPGRVSRIPHRISIHERPAQVERRCQFGHWEADMMQFSRQGAALLVTCERVSRYVALSLAPDLRSVTIRNALTTRLAALPDRMARSVTFDNGPEFHRHHELAKLCRLKTWFCDPHAPWQKGSVENAIRRLRRDLPRSTVAESLSPQILKDIANGYNATPRACLDYQTPLEVYQKQTVALQT